MDSEERAIGKFDLDKRSGTVTIRGNEAFLSSVANLCIDAKRKGAAIWSGEYRVVAEKGEIDDG